MTGGGEPAARQARAPLRQRSRRRWAIAGGVAAGWVVLEVMTGSAVSATLVLVAIAALAGASLAGLRALGITRDHPWLQRMASDVKGAIAFVVGVSALLQMLLLIARVTWRSVT